MPQWHRLDRPWSSFAWFSPSVCLPFHMLQSCKLASYGQSRSDSHFWYLLASCSRTFATPYRLTYSTVGRGSSLFCFLWWGWMLAWHLSCRRYVSNQTLSHLLARCSPMVATSSTHIWKRVLAGRQEASYSYSSQLDSPSKQLRSPSDVSPESLRVIPSSA